MPVVPTGAPAWTRTVSFVHYGGNLNKENYLSRGPIDPTTDLAAEEHARMVADQAAVVRTAAFAVISYTCNDSSPAAPTINVALLMTGVNLISYAGNSPPAGFPSAARNSNGDVTFTFASSYVDEYGVTGAFAPLIATATGRGSTPMMVVCDITGNTVRVRAFDDTGAAIQNARVTLEVQ